MQRYIALLRGVNVGGVRIRMPELAELCGGIGMHAAKTYVQSGNVVFTADAPRDRIGPALEAAIAERFGHRIRVMLRTPAEMDAVLGANPYLDDEQNPARLHVVFLSEPPDAALAAALDPDRSPPDRFRVIGSEIYLHTPEGLGRSKLGVDWFERGLGVAATTRNWNSVRNLRDLASALPA